MEQFQKLIKEITKRTKKEKILCIIFNRTFSRVKIDAPAIFGRTQDFSIIDDTHRGMIESKNYKKNIPKKNEIKNFINVVKIIMIYLYFGSWCSLLNLLMGNLLYFYIKIKITRKVFYCLYYLQVNIEKYAMF